jgi:hypothetical protein
MRKSTLGVLESADAQILVAQFSETLKGFADLNRTCDLRERNDWYELQDCSRSYE